MKRLACSGLLLLAAVGCGGKDTSTTTAEGQNGATPTAAAQTAVVTNGASTEPGEIVALFLDSLRRGDEKAANGVLTAQAQASLAKTDYTIDPLGTPDGKYTIGRVGFVDGDTTTGLVECVWSEPNPEAGKPPVEMEIVCEVHKEPQGWRISGMAVKMAGTEDTFVLDFEDPQSLQQALGGGTQTQSPANVAQMPGAPATGTATPGAAAPGVGTPGMAMPGQVAMPGQPNAGQATTGQAAPAQFGQVYPQPVMPGQPAAVPPTQFPTAEQPAAQIAFPPNPTINR